jgi:pimeloyl-ACP methyl ester carboxylesterase
MSVSTSLGDPREVSIPQGTIRYCERGEGEPIVFIHPMIVNGDLWRDVVPPLAQRYRCITADWPLGGHRPPMNVDADLTPRGIAQIVADFIEALDLDGVTLVGNDTGGAIAQIVAADHPGRLARLVLITCDAFDNFPPPAAKPLVWFAHIPGSSAVARLLTRSRRIQLSPLVFGMLAKRKIEPEITRSYLSPSLSNTRVRRDARKALRGLAPKYTLAAAERLPTFDRPALILWNPEDRFFPLEHAYRLADLLPDSRVVEIEDSYTFVPEDQPARVAAAIDDFMRERATARARA